MIDNIAGPDKHTFEIGLVLAGAVSAGAYSAGVVDFLIEALDKWYAARERETSKGIERTRWTVPSHDVRIKAMSGASAGGMVAALVAVSLCENAKPIDHAHLPKKGEANNKLYSSWVLDADIAPMLKTSDLDDRTAPLSSLLDSSIIEQIAEDSTDVQWRGKSRPYVADRLAIFMCVTNLRGVPYSIEFRGPRVMEHGMSNHADYIRFDLIKPEAREKVDSEYLGIALHPDGQSEEEKDAWKMLARSAVASGAFPFALAPRHIKRDPVDYDRRLWVIPHSEPQLESGQWVCAEKDNIPPDWDGPAPNPYGFLSVDSGVMNNEPLEHTRRELAGAELRNKRSGDRATRAVVMIDPFPNPVSFQRDYKPKTGLLSVAKAVVGSLMAQAHFKADELKLAQDADVFSRFVITPTRVRDGKERNAGRRPALASSSLFHFGGFLWEGFRTHDFLLGRRNCQRFLQDHFVLPADNPLFNEWPASLRQADSPYIRMKEIHGKEVNCLPIIPLVDGVTDEEPQPQWPTMSEVKLGGLRKSLGIRTRLVVTRLVAGLIGSRGRLIAALPKLISIAVRVIIFVLSPLIWLSLQCGARWLAGRMMNEVRKNLANAELL